jgi:hypothetical protein
MIYHGLEKLENIAGHIWNKAPKSNLNKVLDEALNTSELSLHAMAGRFLPTTKTALLLKPYYTAYGKHIN